MRMKAPPRRGSPQALRMLAVEVLSVPDEEMSAFTAQVDQLNGEVTAASAKVPAIDSPEASENQRAYQLWQMTKWLPWYMNWLVWRGLHEDGLSRLTSSAGIEFQKWRSEFNVLLQQFKAFGGTSVLVPTDPSAPVVEIEPPVTEDDPWYVRLSDSVGQHMMLTTLLAGAGLLAYAHVTKRI